jgi:hypothetical protein
VQAFYPSAFDREVGCTEAEWLMWLPAAVGAVHWERHGASLLAHVGTGRLRLAWHALPDRRIALIRLPRLSVAFRFEQVSEEERFAFMKRFDLYMQRGGG